MGRECGCQARMARRCLQSGPRLSRSAARRVQAHAQASCALLGVGSSIPKTTLSNDDLAKIVETNDEWISQRTGIRKRHVLGSDDTLVSHATESCKKALDMAGVSVADVDMIIMSTSSPEDLFGSATSVQRELGVEDAIAFDLTAACSGFVLGLITASQFIHTGARKNILVIGADALSRYVDWNDRGTCILFGDGAGAVLLSAGADGAPDAMLAYDMHSDGGGACHLNAPIQGAGSSKPDGDSDARSGSTAFHNIYMNGQEVFRFAVKAVPDTLRKALASAGLAGEDIDWLVMHQANQRILDSAAKKLQIAPEKVISNLAEYGNTSAASVPIALDEAVRSGKIKDQDVLALAGFGAGLTWTSAVVRWR
eukprot:jgi/Ulvmu1/11067/UM007_0249.1